MAFSPAPRCRKCRSRKFVREQPTERPKCAVCGTYAYGPYVAQWQGRWKRRWLTILLALAVVLLGIWVLGQAGILNSCPHPTLGFLCRLGGI